VLLTRLPLRIYYGVSTFNGEGVMEKRSAAEARLAGTHHRPAADPVEVTALGVVLVCHQTPTGSWICCADEDGVSSCARGFSPANAAARWEQTQIHHD
jgi:hypothetical protein